MNKKEPVDGQQATVAGLSGQSKAHLCAASNIRAMPETEIPLAMRGIFLFALTPMRFLGVKMSFFQEIGFTHV